MSRLKKIKNYEELTAHGDIESRRLVLDLADSVLCSLDAYRRIKSMMKREAAILSIGQRQWDLSKKRHIYLLGAGKACNAMAMAVDEILGEYLTKGIAIVKIKEAADQFQNTSVYVGGHPLPNEQGMKASMKMLELISQASSEDLFIAVISGGSSALMNCPVPGITLDEEIQATDLLLKSGAGILEVNAVRRHISRTNGGMLAKAIAERGAELIGIGISDAVGTPGTTDITVPYENYRGTPIGPDPTTFADAKNVIKNYCLEKLLPASVVARIVSGTPKEETPKEFPGNTYFLLNSVPDSCILAAGLAKEKGLSAHILTSCLEGESREAGTFLASIARQIQQCGQPFKPPCLLLFSGETTTYIPPHHQIAGHGGPSQEMTVSFALSADKIPGVCLFSIDSEGTDGTTDAAGGLTDSLTAKTAFQAGVSLREALHTHATYEALSPLKDAVITGNTGTNLCDFNILYVPQRRELLNADTTDRKESRK